MVGIPLTVKYSCFCMPDFFSLLWDCPVCVLMCLFSSSLLLKLFPQPGNPQWWGFSPVCVLKCLFLCSNRWNPRLPGITSERSVFVIYWEARLLFGHFFVKSSFCISRSTNLRSREFSVNEKQATQEQDYKKKRST